MDDLRKAEQLITSKSYLGQPVVVGQQQAPDMSEDEDSLEDVQVPTVPIDASV